MLKRLAAKRRNWFLVLIFVSFAFLKLIPISDVDSISTAAEVKSAQDPFSSPVLAAYLNSLKSDVTAGLYDIETGETFLYRPNRAQRTASIVKIDILTAVLFSAEQKNKSLTKQQSSYANSMIRYSDNDSASALWRQIGLAPGMNSFNHMLGLEETVANESAKKRGMWGVTQTTPNDQLILLKAIVLQDSVINTKSQAYIQNLMEHVTPSQRFGIPTGVPSAIKKGVKNGWYPVSAGNWQVNTVGYVLAPKHRYLAAIMIAKTATYTSGINTVNKISQLIWDFQSSQTS